MEDELIHVMTRLSERISQAIGPDRELDAELSWRLAPDLPEQARVGDANPRRDLSGVRVFDGLFPDWRSRDDIVPPYTSSLDAALSLAGPDAERLLRQALEEKRKDLPLAVALALRIAAAVAARSE